MIRCIAIDDEPLALQQLSRYIARIPELEMLGAFYRVEDAKDAIEREKVDLMFLDIEMPDTNGVDFAHQLGEKAPYIIFTTAYPQYAVEGFRLDAVDYLLKPLSFDEMQQAVEKVKRRQAAAAQLPAKELFLKVSGSVRKIAIEDILYIKGLAEYVQIYTRGATSPITTFDSLKRLDDELSQQGFMRVHKSYIVNLSAIESATRNTTTIADTAIPIGDKYRTNFTLHLKKLLPSSNTSMK